MRKKAATVELNPLIDAACSILSNQHNSQCLVCLDMISILLEVRTTEVIAHAMLRESLLNTLKDENNEVVEGDLKVLVKYVDNSQDLPALIGQIVDVRSVIIDNQGRLKFMM